jgi:hypothetical protein
MEKLLLFHKNPEVEEVHHVGGGGRTSLWVFLGFQA